MVEEVVVGSLEEVVIAPTGTVLCVVEGRVVVVEKSQSSHCELSPDHEMLV